MNRELELLLFMTSLLSGSVRLAAPILLPALGEIFAERAGIINLGLEGMMMMGALSGFVGAYIGGSLWIGVIFAIIVGMLMGLLMALWSVTLQANQVIAGFGITILGSGLSLFLYRAIFGIPHIAPAVASSPQLDIPILSEIPILGPVLFQHSPWVYSAYALVPIGAVILYKTKFGLVVRAVGENPEAADTKGINVFYIRYICMLINGGLAGLGGAFLSLAFQGSFLPGMTAGRGYIGLAVAVFAGWDPVNAIWGSLLFGGAYALQLRLQAMDFPIPKQLLLALPYALTLISLVVVSRGTKVPASLAIPYKRGHEE